MTEIHSPTGTLGARIDELFFLREQKRQLEADIKELNKEMLAIETDILQRLNECGLTKVSGSKATVSTTQTVVPTVKNWDDFWEYVKTNDMHYLLTRSCSSPGFRELYNRGESIPGVEPFTKVNLSLRTL